MAPKVGPEIETETETTETETEETIAPVARIKPRRPPPIVDADYGADLAAQDARIRRLEAARAARAERDDSDGDPGMSWGAVVGIVIAVCVAAVGALFFLGGSDEA